MILSARRSRRTPRTPRRLGATIAAVVSLFTGLLVGLAAPAHALAGATHQFTVTAAWGKATFYVVRIGWTTRVTAWVWDTRADGDCVSADVTLVVDGWDDPHREDFAKNCLGSASGQYVGETDGFRSGGGTGYHSVRVKVCQEDWGSDTCTSPATYSVYPVKAAHPEYYTNASTILNESMTSFKNHKAAGYGPYNWSDDGCSAPWFVSVLLGRDWNSEFSWACKRHDFGYRNFGKGLEIRPTDTQRATVDSRLLSDMKAWCNAHESWNPDCYSAAGKYYAAVRLQGGPHFYTY